MSIRRWGKQSRTARTGRVGGEDAGIGSDPSLTARVVGFGVAGVVFAAGVVVAVASNTPAQFFGAGSLGALVGLSELITRYRDSRLRLFSLSSTWLYMATNASASFAALVAVHAYARDQPAITNVLVAGISAMLVLRSSIAVVKINDREVQAGPAELVTAVLGSIEDTINRHQGQVRSSDAARIMRNVSFAKSSVALSEHCVLLLEPRSDDVAEGLAAAVDNIRRSDHSDHVKSVNLGVVLIRFCGAEVLHEAVTSLGDDIRRGEDSGPVSPPSL